MAIEKGFQRAKSQENALIKSSVANEPPKVVTMTKVVEKTVTDTVKVYDTVKVEISDVIETKEEPKEITENIKEKTNSTENIEKDLSLKNYLQALDLYEKIKTSFKISRDQREEIRSKIESLLVDVSENNKESLWLRGINLVNAFFEGHNDSDESWQKRGCEYLNKAKSLGFQLAEDDFDFYCF